MKEAGEKSQTYASPAIIARRKRILEETRKAIEVEGISALSMSDIGKRAKVAKRTLYNAFQTRDRMVATAIQEYFQEFMESIRHEYPRGTMMHNLERLVSFARRNRKIRNYARAVLAIYFTTSGDDDIWNTMHHMAVLENRQWPEALHGRKQLQPWVNVGELAAQLAAIEYSMINDWSLGRIPDDKIVVRLSTVYLCHILGAVRGAARREIENMLIKIARDGESALPLPKHAPMVQAA